MNKVLGTISVVCVGLALLIFGVWGVTDYNEGTDLRAQVQVEFDRLQVGVKSAPKEDLALQWCWIMAEFAHIDITMQYSIPYSNSSLNLMIPRLRELGKNCKPTLVPQSHLGPMEIPVIGEPQMDAANKIIHNFEWLNDRYARENK